MLVMSCKYKYWNELKDYLKANLRGITPQEGPLISLVALHIRQHADHIIVDRQKTCRIKFADPNGTLRAKWKALPYLNVPYHGDALSRRDVSRCHILPLLFLLYVLYVRADYCSEKQTSTILATPTIYPIVSLLPTIKSMPTSMPPTPFIQIACHITMMPSI